MPNEYPSNSEIEQELVDLLFTNGGANHQMYLSDVYDALADRFYLTDHEKQATRKEVTGSGESRPYWQNLVRSAKRNLIAKGVLHPSLGHGLCWLQDLSTVSNRARTRMVNVSDIESDEHVFDQFLAEDTPQAVDFTDASSPARVPTTTYRILRDTATARKIKAAHDYRCQICNERIDIYQGKYYAEAHHIKPLGDPHNGPDVPENILIVCPNHHVELDYGAITLDLSMLKSVNGHNVGSEFVKYHNLSIVRYGNLSASNSD